VTASARDLSGRPDPRSAGSRSGVDVLVVGSGFAGICMGVHLRRLGLRFLILERASDIGGTWRDNTYPGCACDIPSHLYSFSFEPNPNWSRIYPSQPEILAYLHRCVDKYRLADNILIDSEVREAVFDERARLWRVQTQRGEVFSAGVLVSAMGPLSRPALPAIPGRERFKGRAFHSSAWDHGLNLAGKRVAVIGAGASAIQIVPQIAPQVEKLAVFQRTPPWIVPKWDGPISDRPRLIFRRVPGSMRLFRSLLYWLHESLALGLLNPKLLRPLRGFALAHLARNIADPSLRQALTPRYTIGCKRILLSNDYYSALARPNVELVTDGIAEIRDWSIVTRDGTERPFDVIVFATGFRASDLLTPLRIIGRDGADLATAWRAGAEAFRGVTMAGFPNLFMLVGPNTLLGHNSMIFMIEAQVHYIVQCLKWLRRRVGSSMDPRPEVQARFNRDLQGRMQGSVWASGCKSWYLDAAGKIVTLWPGSTARYWLLTRRLSPSHYRLSPDA
jgi:cation diffusion facilitator CzcD-associated flavoprotein CzcO